MPLRYLAAALAALLLGFGSAAAAPSLPTPLLEELRSSTFVDHQGREVTLQLPAHLDAGVHAPRPGTLASPTRRVGFTRDTLLELALLPARPRDERAWERSLNRLAERTGASPECVAHLRLGITALDDLLRGNVPNAAPDGEAARRNAALRDRLADAHDYPHLRALLRALGGLDVLLPVAEPFLAALQLGALATDEAEQRLHRLRELLQVDDPTADPALRLGYQAAEVEFALLRDRFWSGLVAQLAKGASRLAWVALREVAGEVLGPVAPFVGIAVDLVANHLRQEAAAQRAVLAATVAERLLAGLPERPDPEARTLALQAQQVAYDRLARSAPAGLLISFGPRAARVDWRAHYRARSEILTRALAGE